MRILEVHSGNAVGGDSNKYTFVKEQGNAIAKYGAIVDYYAIVGKGVIGYLKNVSKLRKKIQEFKPDVIHAHFGLCGVVTLLTVSGVPVVITFHNGETLNYVVNFVCSLFSKWAAHVVYVAQHIYDKCIFKSKKYTILPCGVEMPDMNITPYNEAREKLGWEADKKYILFGGNFKNLRKNYPLLKDALELLGRKDVEVAEMKGFSREECVLRMSACDLFALPTKSEGSPQALKEAMACNCPIIATDVADIKHLLGDLDGHYLCSFDPKDVAEKVEKALAFNSRTKGRERIIELGLTNDLVAKKLVEIYTQILNRK